LSFKVCFSPEFDVCVPLLPDCFVQDTDAKEWKRIVQEIIRFVKADTAFQNSRPLRYSVRLDLHPNSHPSVASLEGRQALKLRDVLLTSYHHNEVRRLSMLLQ